MVDFPEDIFEIEATDPVRAILEIDRRLRPTESITSMDDVEVVNRYYQIMKHACKSFGVEFDLEQSEATGVSEGRMLLYLTKTEIDKKKIELLRDKLQFGSTVVLDEKWRDKIHSYLAVVRKIVENADIAQPIRDSIMTKLHSLDAEVDRTRTQVQKFTDVLVGLCEGISAGAEALTPAARLFERVVGAIAQLKSGHPTLALPLPENLGLKPPEPPPSNTPKS